ncbi:hypothetical protein NMY22_g272 [Coprinellus aureogranulatus]|nr:hypothetical protein NMY22_g272 [Coprinellus aureogranulatus]
MLVYKHRGIRLTNANRGRARRWMRNAIDEFERHFPHYERFIWILMSDYHNPIRGDPHYFTIRGFSNDGLARHTMHLYGPDYEDIEYFSNGGATFGYGFPRSRKLDFENKVRDI